MAWRSSMALRVALAALLLGAPVAPRAATQEPFEAAFQGRCGEGSPCEQLCRELHDGTFECGCSPGFELHVDGYGCTQLNATHYTEAPADGQEDVIYQKDVSFSAELEVAPSKYSYGDITTQPSRHKTDRLTQPSNDIDGRLSVNGELSNSFDGGYRLKEEEGISNLIQDGISEENLKLIEEGRRLEEIGTREDVTTLGPSLEQKVPRGTEQPPRTTALDACQCDDCTKCRKNETTLKTPRFSGTSWAAYPTLRGAYKRVRIRIRVRPERNRGVLLLTGEHDDMTGDYLALVLRNGHVEMRFDCGSGAGILRSPDPIHLGRWNTISVYRHSWDAWLKVNSGKRVRGRSKGLFSRMTFREPVWVGGAGNTTGLQDKLGLSDGLLGCVDFLRINGDTFDLMGDAVGTSELAECAPTLAPWKPHHEVTTRETVQDHTNHAIYNINDIVNFEDNDIVMRDASPKDEHKIDNSIEQFKLTNNVPKRKIQPILNDMDYNNYDGMDISRKYQEIKRMEMDIKKCECQHGGGCVGGVCLCPLGYAGDRCEITLDLKVPRFNGSSYLRLPALGNTAQSWLNIRITIKPSSPDGLLLYACDRDGGRGDYFSLTLTQYYVVFTMDMGSGVTKIKSGYPLHSDKWYEVTVNRSGRVVTLTVKEDGASDNSVNWSGITHSTHRSRVTQLRSLFLGGAPQHTSPTGEAAGKDYTGCVKELVINNEKISIVAAALGGVNVDNCDDTHTCSENSLCKETLDHIPIYPQTNDTIHHSIVPKKGIKLKHKKTKHSHRRSKTDRIADRLTRRTNTDRSTDAETDRLMEGKPYDGQTYMKVNYVNEEDLNFGDANVFPSFNGIDSFIHIDDEDTMKRLSRYIIDVNIRFRSLTSSGLLLWSGKIDGDYLALGIENSVLVFRYSVGGSGAVIAANGTRVDDGKWHRARAARNRQAGVLEVDGSGSVGKIAPNTAKHLATHTGLYIGGLPSVSLSTGGMYSAALRGCVSRVSLAPDLDMSLALPRLPHTITNNVGRCIP